MRPLVVLGVSAIIVLAITIGVVAVYADRNPRPITYRKCVELEAGGLYFPHGGGLWEKPVCRYHDENGEETSVPIRGGFPSSHEYHPHDH